MARKKKENDVSPAKAEERITDEIASLKKQNAGLKGEISKLKKIIASYEKKVNDLNQEFSDLTTDYDYLENIYKNTSKELQRLRELAARPWYKRIFG